MTRPKIFLDTEFIEAGPNHPVRLISIGMVNEQNEGYYAIDANCDYSKASPWVIENVLPQLDMSYAKDRNTIRKEIINFLGYKEEILNKALPYEDRPEIWGWYGSYDMILLCQIFGKATLASKYFRMALMDIKQFAERLGNPELPEIKEGKHNAMEDARWHKQMYDYLVQYEKERTET